MSVLNPQEGLESCKKLNATVWAPKILGDEYMIPQIYG